MKKIPKQMPILLSVIGLILVPLSWYLGMNYIFGINSKSVMITVIGACGYGLIFFIIKLILKGRHIRASFNSDNPPSSKYNTAAFITAFVLPLAGLIINQSFSAFGDFSHPLFYIIAAVNGILLLLPKSNNTRLRLAMFYLKSVGYTYILYFFIIFLPITPLGFVGIIFYGLGLLIFAPAMVTLLQGYHLLKEWVILKKTWNNWLVAAVFSLGIITLPLCMAVTFYFDKGNFNTAAQYLEQNDYTKISVVNLNRLQRTLKNIKGSMKVSGRTFGFSDGNTPIISGLYTRLVLDNKIISQENVMRLENLFFDAGHNITERNLSDPSFVRNTVRILDANSETRYDEKSGVYKSWVNLKLENYSSSGNSEYRTEFTLPEGAYISDYYLNVLGKRKEGILTDRRAALFIYRKIVNTRQDPGLLHYIGRNTLELRVFPFAANEVRETGFEILHSQKLTLNLDDKTISLGGDNEQKEIEVDGALLLTSAQKSHLKLVERKPKYYFVIDSSKNSDIAWHIDQIKKYTVLNHIDIADVIFASYKLDKYSLSDISQAKYKAEGGFNLNAAVRTILSSKSTEDFPIIIAVSDNILSAVLPFNINSLSKKFPESSYYYALNHNLTLSPYSFDNNNLGNSIDKPIITPILAYNGIYVQNNDKSEVVLTDKLKNTFTPTGNQYKDAILLNAMVSSEKSDSLELLRGSLRSRILTPQTAFIVVETQDQERELLDVQEKLLSSNGSTPTITLDEPSLTICIILLMLVVLIKKHNFRGRWHI
jgi:hypothetical protein